MRITHLYTNKNGESAFTDLEIKLARNGVEQFANLQAPTAMLLNEFDGPFQEFLIGPGCERMVQERCMNETRVVFLHGAPGFFDLVRDSRALAIRHAVRLNVPLVIITTCYSEPEDQPQLQEIEK